ncbi:hypothetical protein F2Q68_00045667 [Brassica cretica]|uniref:Uncharacterized protein n=1 Tax=Brassica cretica TaxID=69181 RepID=A0A8S9LPA8_BRACR|nr:hypothetical protein F2Q68_00045667 [Brassica cretica]
MSSSILSPSPAPLMTTMTNSRSVMTGTSSRPVTKGGDFSSAHDHHLLLMTTTFTSTKYQIENKEIEKERERERPPPLAHDHHLYQHKRKSD